MVYTVQYILTGGLPSVLRPRRGIYREGIYTGGGGEYIQGVGNIQGRGDLREVGEGESYRGGGGNSV